MAVARSSVKSGAPFCRLAREKSRIAEVRSGRGRLLGLSCMFFNKGRSEGLVVWSDAYHVCAQQLDNATAESYDEPDEGGEGKRDNEDLEIEKP